MNYKGKRNLKRKLYRCDSPGLQFLWTPVNVGVTVQVLLIRAVCDTMPSRVSSVSQMKLQIKTKLQNHRLQSIPGYQSLFTLANTSLSP